MMVQYNSLGGDSANSKLPSDKLANIPHASEHFAQPFYLSPITHPIAFILRGPVREATQNRIKVSNNPGHGSGAHAAPWTGPVKYPLGVMELGFQSTDRVGGQVADGVDQGGVVSQLIFFLFFALQEKEEASVAVDKSEGCVDAAEDHVIRQSLYHTGR